MGATWQSSAGALDFVSDVASENGPRLLGAFSPNVECATDLCLSVADHELDRLGASSLKDYHVEATALQLRG